MIKSVLATVLIVVAFACGGSTAQPRPTAPAGGVLVSFGRATARTEVAATPEERARGLMGRTHLDRDAGMLFVFPRMQVCAARTSCGFWMKNTLIPLSIAYMASDDAGSYRVARIMEMVPCRADPCPVYNPGVAFDATLEMNTGWFGRAGVSRGARATVEGNLRKPV